MRCHGNWLVHQAGAGRESMSRVTREPSMPNVATSVVSSRPPVVRNGGIQTERKRTVRQGRCHQDGERQ